MGLQTLGSQGGQESAPRAVDQRGACQLGLMSSGFGGEDRTRVCCLASGLELGDKDWREVALVAVVEDGLEELIGTASTFSLAT